MSIYGHYSQQYYGKKNNFPEESFLISGISFHQENCKDIDYESELTMVFDTENIYDKNAISISNGEKLLGYVPAKIDKYKKICSENITEPLKILNIQKIEGIYGIRVIPKCFLE